MLAAFHVLFMLAAAVGLGAFCALAIRRIARGRVLRWQAERVRAAGGEHAVRGRLVVRASEASGGVATAVAETTYAASSRVRLEDAYAGASARADSLVIIGEEGETELVGAIDVVAGSRIVWHVGKKHLGAIQVVATVESGDIVRAFGRVTSVGESEGVRSDYRKAGAAKRLEGAEPNVPIRLVYDAAPRIARVGQWRQPMVIVVALVGAWLPFGALIDLVELQDDPDGLCHVAGDCRPIPKWLGGSWKGAAADWLKGKHFRRGAAFDSDCRASRACILFGACTASKGSCRATREDDCHRSWYCAVQGSCSVVGGRCAPARDEDCAFTEYCTSIGYCSAIGGSCRPGKHADCAQTSSCKSYGACSAVDGSCSAGRDADCAGTYGCRNDARCSAVGGRCVATDSSCKASADCLEHGRCRAVDGECAALGDEDCRWSQRCAEWGDCSAKSGSCERDPVKNCVHGEACRVHGACGGDGFCAPRDEKDCKESLGCKERGECRLIDGSCKKSCAEHPDCALEGRCTEASGRCIAGSNIECKTSAGCAKFGRCSSLEGRCEVGGNEDCAQSFYCRENGRCTARGHECALTADADCQRTTACAADGRCAFKDGNCALDCAASAACKSYGACSVVAGHCGVAKDADCSESEVCKRMGWCVAATATSKFGYVANACFNVALVEL